MTTMEVLSTFNVHITLTSTLYNLSTTNTLATKFPTPNLAATILIIITKWVTSIIILIVIIRKIRVG